jgi:hypothetical protein
MITVLNKFRSLRFKMVIKTNEPVGNERLVVTVPGGVGTRGSRSRPGGRGSRGRENTGENTWSVREVPGAGQ